MTLEAILSNVGRDKNTATGEELYKASIKLTKKQADERGVPSVNLTIKTPDEQELQDLLDKGEITVKFSQST